MLATAQCQEVCLQGNCNQDPAVPASAVHCHWCGMPQLRGLHDYKHEQRRARTCRQASSGCTRACEYCSSSLSWSVMNWPLREGG